MRVIAIAILLMLAACKSGSSTTTDPPKPDPVRPDPRPKPDSFVIDVSGYDHSCTTDADCQLVATDPCSRCGCPQHAISVKDRAKHAEVLAAIDCTKAPPIDPAISCGSCMSPEVHCVAGACEPK